MRGYIEIRGPGLMFENHMSKEPLLLSLQWKRQKKRRIQKDPKPARRNTKRRQRWKRTHDKKKRGIQHLNSKNAKNTGQ